ncbi:hypothetical protein CA13_38060 [Planctomycetes bacterium CA13]|uniref:Uncharacterized protein n=1 Tax=Novipirellula herctigrandis TaxID=2527986 RepID=A0A5C5Z516_9BACT|nr:hypothetical protein CA13_38060 [Planctomycetes bacterium CA13]
MSSFRMQIGGVFLSILLTGPAAWAGGLCSHCGGTGHCEKMVPVTVTKMKMVEETCYREEQQVKTVLVPKVIQVEQLVPYEYTAWVRVKKEDPQELEIKTPKFRWVDQKYTITVPGKDTVTKTRKRTEMVPTTEICTVTEDHGYYETKMVATKTCGGCLCTEKKVWCPCPVEVLKEKTVMKPVTIEEPYTCEVDICVPIEKTRRVKEYFTKVEKKTVKNPYTTLEPRKRTKMVTAFVPETVHEEKTEICTVKVPYTVVREVPVQVTCMVPEQQACSCQSN